MRKLLILTFLLAFAGCSNQPPRFTTELEGLREYFHIPGMAVIVVRGNETLYERYMGFSDVENQIPMDSTTTIPMASLTKMFSGMLVKQMDVLDKPINEYIGANVGDSVKVRHIVTHTSQGKVGQHFYYSNRYSWLTNVIEKELNKSFEDAINSSVANLGNTYLLKDSLHLRKIAKPYVFEGEVKPGFIDYGYSSSAGIVSTVRDIAKFGKQINDNGKLGGLYGYGLFSQTIEGKKVLWSYGQYDCYSSLFIRVPEDDLTLVMAANNSLMSDPARLIYGDVRSSLFALSFFWNFLNMKLPREELRAKAVAESFLARYDVKHADTSKALLRKLFKEYPDYRSYGDLTLLHNLRMIESDEFDEQTIGIGATLLKQDIDNPYANVYMANYYMDTPDSARVFYRRIVDAKNFEKHWYTREAESWLSEHP